MYVYVLACVYMRACMYVRVCVCVWGGGGGGGVCVVGKYMHFYMCTCTCMSSCIRIVVKCYNPCCMFSRVFDSDAIMEASHF